MAKVIAIILILSVAVCFIYFSYKVAVGACGYVTQLFDSIDSAVRLPAGSEEYAAKKKEFTKLFIKSVWELILSAMLMVSGLSLAMSPLQHLAN